MKSGGLTGLGRRIAEILKEHEPAAPGHADSVATECRSASRAVSGRRLLEGVASAVRARLDLAIGRVNLVELGQVSHELGNRWPSIADRADIIVRRAIEGHLDVADAFAPMGDHRYLIVFANLSLIESGLKCAAIRDEVTRLLLGDDPGGLSVGVQTAAAMIDGSLRFDEISSVTAMLEQLYGLTGGEPSTGLMESGGRTMQHEESGPGGSVRGVGALDGVQIVYRPMWDVERNVVSTFVSVPAVEPAPGHLAIGEECIPGIDEPAVRQALDAMLLRRAILDLLGIVERRRKLLLVVPVHFESLATAARRDAFAESCRVIPSDLRSYLILELVGAPEGVPQSRLLELTSALKPYCRSVLLRVSLADAVFRPVGDTGIGVIGVNLVGLRWPEKRLMQAFDRFCEGAQKVGLSTYIQGLRTMSMTTAALASGFRYIDGDTVMSVVDEPAGIFRYDTRVMIRRWTRPAS